MSSLQELGAELRTNYCARQATAGTSKPRTDRRTDPGDMLAEYHGAPTAPALFRALQPRQRCEGGVGVVVVSCTESALMRGLLVRTWMTGTASVSWKIGGSLSLVILGLLGGVQWCTRCAPYLHDKHAPTW